VSPETQDSRRSVDVKVGLFVLLGAAALIGATLLLGQKKHVFERRVRVHSVFSDVGGLVVGAPVEISGVGVGSVSRIAFDRTGPRPVIRVDMSISEAALDLLSADSVARISSQGLLGDKLIDISAGTSSASRVQPNGLVASTAPADLDMMVAEAAHVMKKLERVADGAAALADELSSPRTLANIRGSFDGIHALLQAAAHGQGLAHALFYDRKTAQAVGHMLAAIDRLAAKAAQAVEELEPIVNATTPEGRQLINHLSSAARNVSDVAASLHRSRLVNNLERATDDLAQVTGQLRTGRGTLGALVQDPAVYEQLVTILGGVARSRILRALVRYAISKGESGEVRRLDVK
jgi:phospholipid/cholesterol/gamma-HCH transport system substrate-binding protein